MCQSHQYLDRKPAYGMALVVCHRVFKKMSKFSFKNKRIKMFFVCDELLVVAITGMRLLSSQSP